MPDQHRKPPRQTIELTEPELLALGSAASLVLRMLHEDQMPVDPALAGGACKLRLATAAGIRAPNREASMRRLAVALIAMAGIVALTSSPAFAEIETSAQTQARANVESQAAQVGEAPNEAKAISDQRTLMPAVKKAVEAGARKSLIEHVSNPSVIADVLRLTKPKVVRKSEGLPPVKVKKPANAPVAHTADACWNDAWGSLVEWSGVAWLYVRSNPWCGRDGWWLYWYSGTTFAEWTWGDVCFTGHGEDFSWDLYPSWIHMANWAEAGVGYIWGCLGISGGKATERIAANGYWDFYDDYGF